MLPAFAFLVVFLLGPAVSGFFWGTTDKRLGSTTWHEIGLANLREAIHDPQVKTATINTILLVVVTVPLAMAIGLGLAHLVARLTRGAPIIRLLLFLPVTANLVAMSVVFQYIFSQDQTGLANAVLGWFGVAPIDWLHRRWPALLVIMLIGLWRLSSLVFVLYLAGMTAIPTSIDEAAELDGLRGWSRFRHVTWPLLKPTSVFVAVVSVVLTLQTFETVAVVTRGEPGGQSETLVYRIYDLGFGTSFRVGYANMLTSLMLIVIVLVGIAGSLAGRRARQAREAT